MSGGSSAQEGIHVPREVINQLLTKWIMVRQQVSKGRTLDRGHCKELADTGPGCAASSDDQKSQRQQTKIVFRLPGGLKGNLLYFTKEK